VGDEALTARIEQLINLEHELRHREEHEQSSDGLDRDVERLREVEVELDVCWDLLRQRRALRRSGADADEAEPRDADTVERYLQ